MKIRLIMHNFNKFVYAMIVDSWGICEVDRCSWHLDDEISEAFGEKTSGHTDKDVWCAQLVMT